MDKTLSTADVAKRLQVHPTTVQGWIRKGHFPNAHKLGLGKNSPYIIPESDVIAFEEERHQTTQ
jgi:excisionase family DNA binding protein